MKNIIKKHGNHVSFRRVDFSKRYWVGILPPSSYSSQQTWLKKKDFIYFWKEDGKYLMKEFYEIA